MKKSLTIVKRTEPVTDGHARVERSPALAEVRYRRLFEGARTGILIIDARTNVITDVNPYLSRLLGYAPEEFIGRTPWEVEAFGSIEASLNAVAALLGRTHVRYDALALQARDGRLIHVEVVSDVYVVGDDRVIQCHIRDITGPRLPVAASSDHEHHLGAAALEAVHTVARALRVAQTPDQALPILLDEALTALGADAGAIWLHRLGPDELHAAVVRGWFRQFTETPLKPDEGIVGTVFATGRAHTTAEFTDDGPVRRPTAFRWPSGLAGACVPIRSGAITVGVLTVCVPASRRIRAEHVRLLESLAEMGGAALHRMRLREETVQQVERLQTLSLDLSLAYDATIEGWSRALDLRDNETEVHTQRVAEITVRLAREVGISEAELVHVRRGALLHDIGKISVPDRILLKPGPLTEEEWIVMRMHPTVAYDMLAPVSHLRPALDIPYCHHEKWDGSGYPRGLKGDEIPLAARVFAVVDVWDALRSNRPYRPAWPADRVIEHIRSLAGTHFDPEVVRVFLASRVFDSPRPA